MSGKALRVMAGVAMGLVAGPAAAQNAAESQERERPQIVRRQDQFRALDQLRYQISMMERVLEGAVEHGASVVRDRMQAIAPVQAMLLENARVRGYRLDGYGLFFDVDVPSMETTLFAALQTLDQNGLGLQSAVNTLKTYLQGQAANDAAVQQAFKRIELQLPALTPAPEVTTARPTAGTAVASADRPSADATDPILNNPAEVFRAEVMQAVVDAMLDFSGPLGVASEEWLAVGVRRNEMRPRIGLETNAQTVIARVRGGDLTAFHAGQISRDDVSKRIEVRVQ